MTFDPPPAGEVAARVTQRSDDTEEKVVTRLEQFHAHVQAVCGFYADKMVEVNGAQGKDVVYAEIKACLDSAA